MSYLHHGLDDAGQEVPASWFECGVAWIKAALEQRGTTVLAHCHMGINRGPSLGYAVLLTQGWDCVEALAALRAARPQANAWYAADALRWHHDRTGVPADEALADQARLAAWRDEHPLDVVRLIRRHDES